MTEIDNFTKHNMMLVASVDKLEFGNNYNGYIQLIESWELSEYHKLALAFALGVMFKDRNIVLIEPITK